MLTQVEEIDPHWAKRTDFSQGSKLLQQTLLLLQNPTRWPSTFNGTKRKKYVCARSLALDLSALTVCADGAGREKDTSLVANGVVAMEVHENESTRDE